MNTWNKCNNVNRMNDNPVSLTFDLGSSTATAESKVLSHAQPVGEAH